MNRVIGLIVLLVAVSFPTASFADGDQIGVYISPKFVYGLSQFKHPKEIGRDSWDNYRKTTEGIGSKTDDVFGGSIAIGYDFDKQFDIPVRTEIEYSAFTKAKIKYDSFYDPGVECGRSKHQYEIQTLFWNTYYDINTGTKFTPYIGAGIGLAFIDYKYHTEYYSLGTETADQVPTLTKNNTNFAWNVGAGLGYDLTDYWTLDVGYRFVGLGSVKTKTGHGADSQGDWSWKGKTENLYQHQFSFGVRYTF